MDRSRDSRSPGPLVRTYPDLQVVGTLSPPFGAITPDEDEAMVQAINATRSDIIWVGLLQPGTLVTL